MIIEYMYTEDNHLTQRHTNSHTHAAIKVNKKYTNNV